MPYKNKEKRREYSKNWVARRRRKFFKGKKCALCGSSRSLVLHHKNKKEKEGHCIWSWSEERQKAEIRKCVVWCKKCHDAFHGKEKRKPMRHGTIRKYKSGCKCALCRERRALSDREYRAKLKERGCSSIGRALACHARGSEIETRQPRS